MHDQRAGGVCDAEERPYWREPTAGAKDPRHTDKCRGHGPLAWVARNVRREPRIIPQVKPAGPSRPPRRMVHLRPQPYPIILPDSEKPAEPVRLCTNDAPAFPSICHFGTGNDVDPSGLSHSQLIVARLCNSKRPRSARGLHYDTRLIA